MRSICPAPGVSNSRMDADVVVFDPRIVIDRAGLQHPVLEPAGIDVVIVNGVLIRNEGAFVAGALPGRAVRLDRPVARTGR